MAVHEIHLSVTSDGNFSVLNPEGGSAANKRVNKGDSVAFRCSQGPCLVRFLGRTPGTKIDYPVNGLLGLVGTLQMRADAQPGKYKYLIAIFDGGKIWVDDSCPEIIIEW